MPALNSNNLSEDIKESLIRTLIRFEIADTLEDINAFFNEALVSSRGEEIFNYLNDKKLLAFENIREEYNKIYYS
jgi:hypothetical protein